MQLCVYKSIYLSIMLFIIIILSIFSGKMRNGPVLRNQTARDVCRN